MSGFEARRVDDLIAALEATMAEAPMGVALVDLELQLLWGNAALRASDVCRGAQLRADLPSPASERLGAHLKEALDGTPTVADLVELGGEHWVIRTFPARVGGVVAGVVLIVAKATDDARSAAQLTLLQHVAAALAPATTEKDVADVVLRTVGDALEVATSSLWLVDADDAATLVLAYERGAEAGAIERFATLPLDADLPGPVVVATGQPVFIHSKRDRDERWPALIGTPSPSEALAVLPLTVEDRRLGCLAFGYGDERTFPADERAALVAVAEQCAVALDRARLYDQLRDRAVTNEILADISALLTGNVDWVTLARNVTTACVPAIADLCALYIREGSLVRRVAMASATSPDVERLIDRYPAPLSAEAPYVVAIRTGVVQRISHMPAGAFGAVSDEPDYLELTAALRADDGIIVPLRDGDTAFAAMGFAFGESERTYDPQVYDLAVEVAERTASAFRAAQVFARQRAAVRVLHEVALPAAPPEIDGLSLAACYVPFTEGAEIGGDWWDTMQLRDGRIALVVGDVAGHGVNMGAAMGALRHSLRVYLHEGASPAEALTSLGRLVEWERPAALVTTVVAIYDPRDRSFQWAAAGHPPPLVVESGVARYLEHGAGPPLGIGAMAGATAYRDLCTSLQPGSTIYLYTDGLVEGRRQRIDDGLDRFARVAARRYGLGWTDFQAHTELVLAAVVEHVDDDICLLAMHVG